MIIVEVVQDWRESGVHVELPGVPRRGDVIIVNSDLDGTVQEVVWEPGEQVRVRIE